MGIMTRLLRLWKADIHGVMDQLEDKELLIKQYLREMENSLRQKESDMKQTLAAIGGARRDLAEAREQFDKRDKDLELALRNDKEDIARLLIRKQKLLQATSDHLQRHLTVLEERKNILDSRISEQRLQYDELKTKAQAFYSKTARDRLETIHDIMSQGRDMDRLDEKEIELELIRRKEALRQDGGGA